MIKEIKPETFRDAEATKEPFVLSIIPELSKRKNFVRRTYKSKDMKSRVTNDTSNGWCSRY